MAILYESFIWNKCMTFYQMTFKMFFHLQSGQLIYNLPLWHSSEHIFTKVDSGDFSFSCHLPDLTWNFTAFLITENNENNMGLKHILLPHDFYY